ncbi:hypothetical protein LEP3755_33960 [Leptolyngbya sp. NIES-3755]|nr:hypothetical protein LEP3755_33960 [Leptolyngbya sp. NIES-3755]
MTLDDVYILAEFDDLADLITLKQFTFMSLNQRKAWLNRNEKLKKKTGRGIEQYFTLVDDNDDLYFNPMVFNRVILNAIKSGRNWIDERDLIKI